MQEMHYFAKVFLTMNQSDSNYLPLFIFLLALKAAVVIVGIYSGVIGLGPDEAQYWTWSQSLAWGYYSKPPGIAWEIWAGTHLFGNTELGVRFFSVVISFLLSLSVYFLARACELSPKAAFWSGLVMAFCPLGMAASFLATTDGGMVLFWTLALIFITSPLSKEKTPNYYAIGLMIFLGALFKWPIYLLWLLIFLFAIRFPNMRSMHLLGGVALSFLALFSSLIWNISHDWATFRHVTATIQGGHGEEIGTFPILKGNFFEFLGAQAILLSPIWFGLLLTSFVFLIKRYKNIPPAIQFCGVTSLLILGSYSAFSIFQKMQGNWCVFVYPSAIVFLCWFVFDSENGKKCWFVFEREHRKKWLGFGLSLSLLLCFIAVSTVFFPIPFKFNPFKHNLGWEKLRSELEQVGYKPNDHFLFSDKYQMSSILSFYSRGQKRAYFMNLGGVRKNQFSYWPSMSQEQREKPAFLF